MRIAVVHAEQLADPTAAIEAWQRVMRDFGEDPDTVNALADLLAGPAAGRSWPICSSAPPTRTWSAPPSGWSGSPTPCASTSATRARARLVPQRPGHRLASRRRPQGPARLARGRDHPAQRRRRAGQQLPRQRRLGGLPPDPAGPPGRGARRPHLPDPAARGRRHPAHPHRRSRRRARQPGRGVPAGPARRRDRGPDSTWPVRAAPAPTGTRPPTASPRRSPRCPTIRRRRPGCSWSTPRSSTATSPRTSWRWPRTWRRRGPRPATSRRCRAWPGSRRGWVAGTRPRSRCSATSRPVIASTRR